MSSTAQSSKDAARGPCLRASCRGTNPWPLQCMHASPRAQHGARGAMRGCTLFPACCGLEKVRYWELEPVFDGERRQA